MFITTHYKVLLITPNHSDFSLDNVLQDHQTHSLQSFSPIYTAFILVF